VGGMGQGYASGKIYERQLIFESPKKEKVGVFKKGIKPHTLIFR